MTTPNKTHQPLVDTVPKLVNLLEPLSPEDRQKALSAALILLGDSPVSNPSSAAKNVGYALQDDSDVSPKAQNWMGKNLVTREQLDHIFSIEPGSIDIIASQLPGNSKKQQTVYAYLLCGLKTYLSSGEVTFGDKEARDVCQKVGCYDSANHSAYMKAFSNLIGGSKEIGWKLTNPGLSEAAKIVKTLAPNNA